MEISNASGIARIARKLRVNCAYPRPPSPVSRACSNAPVGLHTVSVQDTGSSGNHGQPGRVMRVLPVVNSS